MKNEILLIAYKFPPYPEVGAYRWAKFAKYFADSGIKVHVVTVKWNENIGQYWFKDIDNPNIKIYRIKSGYIHKFKYKKFPNTFPGKLLKKFRNQILKISYLKNYIDEAQNWGKYLLPVCEKIISDNKIKHVIATGGPFMTNYWASILKCRSGDIKLIHDFRDEWYEDDRFKFDFQKKKNIFFRDYSLKNCDGIITVSKGLAEYFKKNVNNDKIKIDLIYNGYDNNDSESKQSFKKIKRDFSFLYAGSLSNGRDTVMSVFLDTINKKIEKYNNISITLYSSVNNSLKNKYKKLIKNGNLIISNYIPQQELFEKIKNTFCTLHFMPESQKFIISIKLFEYAVLGRPVFSINCGGDTDELIGKYNLGLSVNYNNIKKIETAVDELYNLWKKNPDYIIKCKNIEDFSYKKLAKKYIDFIKNL